MELLLNLSKSLALSFPRHVVYLLVHDGARHLPDLTEAELCGVQQNLLPAQPDLDVEGDHTSSSSSSDDSTTNCAPSTSSSSPTAAAGAVRPP